MYNKLMIVRYILLLIIAVLLPVLAFLNFNYRFDNFKSKQPNNQAASLILREVGGSDDAANATATIPSDKDDGKGLDEKTTTSTVKEGSIVSSDIPQKEESTQNTKPEPSSIGNKSSDKKISGGVGDYINKFIGSFQGSDPGEVEKSTQIKYILPRATYTSPSNFPLTAVTTQPYLERLKNPSFVPMRNWDIDFTDVDAQSSLVIEPGTQKVLYNKDIFDTRPIASLTKLMSALAVIDSMNLKEEVVISKTAVDGYGEMGGLVIDEKLTVENLLYIMLISSSNDAAIALEEYFNTFVRIDENDTFVSRMNKKVQELKLFDTLFVEPTGLDQNNISTAYDLARLADYAFARPILREIMSTPVIDIQSVDGMTTHHIANSNKLLGVLPGVLGGKTGYTEEAGESIVLFVKKNASGEADDYLIYIILGSKDRTKAARQLIDWIGRAYVWK